jgi:hypothetical protein
MRVVPIALIFFPSGVGVFVLLLYPLQRRPLPCILETSSKGRLYQKKFYVLVRSLSNYYFACRKKLQTPNPLIACQDVSPPKDFDMKNRPKPGVGLVDCHLKCCIEARFWKNSKHGKESLVLQGKSFLHPNLLLPPTGQYRDSWWIVKDYGLKKIPPPFSGRALTVGQGAETSFTKGSQPSTPVSAAAAP